MGCRCCSEKVEETRERNPLPGLFASMVELPGSDFRFPSLSVLPPLILFHRLLVAKYQFVIYITLGGMPGAIRDIA